MRLSTSCLKNVLLKCYSYNINSGADKCKFEGNRSKCDTSTKICMDVPLGSLFWKSTLATQKLKMAGIFQDGRHFRWKLRFDHLKCDRMIRFELSWCLFICFRGCRSWIYNSKAHKKLPFIPFSMSVGHNVPNNRYNNCMFILTDCMGCRGVVVDVVLSFQRSATSSGWTGGWTAGTSPHYLPNSYLWLQEAACAQQRPHPGTLRWLAG